MPTYKTPNVYVEEIPTLPPSIVPVATAVPAFIGYTEKAGNQGDYHNRPTRISSLLDYTNLFGGAKATEFTVTLDPNDQIEQITASHSDTAPPNYLLYYALRLFFDNGGSSCYIVSIGNYSQPLAKQAFKDGLDALRQEDEPTLLVLTDAVNLPNTDYYELCQLALKQCNDLKDRFAIFDILAGDRDQNGVGAGFRQGIGMEYLKYGAAYYPNLQTALTHTYTEASVRLSRGRTGTIGRYQTHENGLLVTYAGPQTDQPKIQITLTDRTTIGFDIAGKTLTLRLPKAGAPPATIVSEWAQASTQDAFTITVNGSGSEAVTTTVRETLLTYDAAMTQLLGDTAIKQGQTALHNRVKTALDAKRVVLPPSAAVAGIYAKVDRERGVWKAPANVSLASVISPMVKLTNEEQEALNVDATAGKSINAIRSFTGKGTLVWGARTLAGNDNEWRYVPVRRLFNLIEESTQKATAFVVFESNSAITWLKVKTIIETYLDGLWRQGALAGATQQEAYFVGVGLGQTMTAQDILEGRMIIEIGIAAVRPAEFIVLRFSHKLQQA